MRHGFSDEWWADLPTTDEANRWLAQAMDRLQEGLDAPTHNLFHLGQAVDAVRAAARNGSVKDDLRQAGYALIRAAKAAHPGQFDLR